MTETSPLAEDDLNAYVDGRLPPAEMPRVEAWLAGHPEDAARVHAYRLQNRRLHATFDPVLDEPVPAALATLVATRIPRRPASMPVLLRLAAAILLFALGGVAGWSLRGLPETETVAASPPPPALQAAAFVGQAMGAHRVFVAEVRHPVEVPASQQDHLTAWLSKRLGTTLRAPDISAEGYGLIGGRLLAEGSRPAAQFMYERKDGGRLTVYVRGAEATEDTAFRFVSAEGQSAFYWVDRAFAYALIAPVERDRLSSLAHRVHADLSRP